MGLEDLVKEGESLADGQDSSNQQVQSEQSGGNESRNDTMLDSGKFSLTVQLLQVTRIWLMNAICSRR